MSTKSETKNENESADEALTDEQLESVAGGVFIKSWSTSGDADDRPTEQISFNYTKITF